MDYYKKYIGNKYEDDIHSFKQTSMGVVLKRRDNANIVKIIYGGIIEKILNEKDIKLSINFLRESLQKLINGNFGLEELIISKALKSEYKDPTRIAHKVLADRMKQRDPGSAPQVNDRLPYVYVQTECKKGQKLLQGEKIEHPDYIREHGLKPDYEFYITNQIMKPTSNCNSKMKYDSDIGQPIFFQNSSVSLLISENFFKIFRFNFIRN